MIARAYSLSFGQLSDRRLWWIAAKALALSAGAFVALWWGLDAVTGWLTPPDWPDFLDEAVAWLGLALALWLAAPAAFAAATGFFLEEVADVVESRHYPDDQGREAPILRGLNAGLRLAGLSLLLNLLLLPFYFLPPPLNVTVYVLLNGYVLGREYFEIAALRHLTVTATRRLTQRVRTRVILAGMAAVGLTVVPVVQLIAPIVGAAAMTHVFHTSRREFG